MPEDVFVDFVSHELARRARFNVDPTDNPPAPKKSNAGRGEDAAKTTGASTSAPKDVKQAGASSSTEQRQPCRWLTIKGIKGAGEDKRPCQTFTWALLAMCSSCVKRFLKGKSSKTKREMWASALRNSMSAMREKRQVTEEQMRKIFAWVGNKDNKADMPRPGWLDKNINACGLKSLAPGYVTRLEACWLAYWFNEFKLFKLLYDELVNYAPQYRRDDANLVLTTVLTRPKMQAVEKNDEARKIVFQGDNPILAIIHGSPTSQAEKFAQLMKIEPSIKFLDWLRERTHWGGVDSPEATKGDIDLFALFEPMIQCYVLDVDVVESWIVFRYLHLHRDRLRLTQPQTTMKMAVKISLEVSMSFSMSLEYQNIDSLFVRPLHEDWGLLFFNPEDPPNAILEPVFDCIEYLNLHMLKHVVEHGYKEYPGIVHLMKQRFIEVVDTGELILDWLEDDEDYAFTEIEKFIIYFETLDNVENDDKKHINALYEIVEEHKTSLSEGVFIGVMKYLQRQHDKATEIAPDNLLRRAINDIVSDRNAMLMAGGMPFAGLFRRR